MAALSTNANSAALIMSGKTLMSARVIATTNGDAAVRIQVNQLQYVREWDDRGIFLPALVPARVAPTSLSLS